MCSLQCMCATWWPPNTSTHHNQQCAYACASLACLECAPAAALTSLLVCRFESSSAILGSMGEAADALVTSGMQTGRVACRVMYRLAHHADTLYAAIQAQKQSPEWNTAQAVIKQKRQQVCHRASVSNAVTW